MNTYQKQLERQRKWKERKRRSLGVPVRGHKPYCINGHSRTPGNIRPGRSDCAICHREQARQRNRLNGAKPSTAKNQNGKSRTRAYKIWNRMIDRCHNLHHDKFPFYGARGIAVCQKWRESFNAFLADMGQPPEKLTLDRIDTFGNYEPTNCRWATKEQQVHNMRNNRWIEYQGEKYLFADLAKKIGMNRYTLYNRLFIYHWPIEKAVLNNNANVVFSSNPAGSA